MKLGVVEAVSKINGRNKLFETFKRSSIVSQLDKLVTYSFREES